MAPKFRIAPKSQHGAAAQVLAKFQEGIAFHQNGKLEQAQALYEQILKISPKHFHALNLLGLIAFHTGKYARALDLNEKALAINSKDPCAFCNRGNVLFALGQLEAAIVCHDKAIALKPDYAEAYYNRGNAQQGLRQLAAAVASYDQAIALNPKAAEAYSNRGSALKALKQFAAAVASYDQAIALNPNFVEAYSNRGNALKEQQQLTAALASYDKAIAIKPDYAEAYYNRGNILHGLKQLEAAVASYDMAIALNPNAAEAYSNRASVLRELKQFDLALGSVDRAIAIRPNYAEAHFNRGNLLRECMELEAAIVSFEQAIAIQPNYAAAYFNRGNVFQQMMQLEAAVASYDQAIAIQPDFPGAYFNRGNAQRDLLELDAALASYDRAIALKGDFSDAYWNKSLPLLLRGDFADGWQLYERRWERTGAPSKRVFSPPMWRGAEALAGKTILLYTEQGLGDTLQFCRYVPLLAAQGARVLLEVEPCLIDVLKTLAGVEQLIEKDSALPAFDFHCPLMSLPLALGTTLASIPAYASYLQVDPVRLARWSQQLPPRTKPRIGIVWSGSTTLSNDQNRTIQLAQFIAQLPPQFDYVSLQKEVREVDRPALAAHPEILHFGEQLRDFGDTAALCALMDVVISVDTSVAHLNAALGKPTWVLLPYSPDWRWLLEREDSPWYPSVQLFRQSSARSWPEVFAKIRMELEEIFADVHADGR